MKRKQNQLKVKRLIPSYLWDSKNDLPFLSNCPKTGQRKFVTLIKNSPITQLWKPPTDLIDFFHQRFPCCNRTVILKQLQFEAEIVREEILKPFNASKNLSLINAQVNESITSQISSPVNLRKRKNKWDYIHPESYAWSELQRDRKGLYTSYYRET